MDNLALPRPFRMRSRAAFPNDGRTKTGMNKAGGTGPGKLARTVVGEYDRFERNDA